MTILVIKCLVVTNSSQALFTAPLLSSWTVSTYTLYIDTTMVGGGTAAVAMSPTQRMMTILALSVLSICSLVYLINDDPAEGPPMHRARYAALSCKLVPEGDVCVSKIRCVSDMDYPT